MNLSGDMGYDSSSDTQVRCPWLLGFDVIDDSVGPKGVHGVTSDGIVHKLGAELPLDLVRYPVTEMSPLIFISAKTCTLKLLSSGKNAASRIYRPGNRILRSDTPRTRVIRTLSLRLC